MNRMTMQLRGCEHAPIVSVRPGGGRPEIQSCCTEEVVCLFWVSSLTARKVCPHGCQTAIKVLRDLMLP